MSDFGLLSCSLQPGSFFWILSQTLTTVRDLGSLHLASHMSIHYVFTGQDAGAPNCVHTAK